MRGAELIAEILRSAPAVKFLVTSQERLNLQGEWLLEVEGMPFPAGSLAAGIEPTDYGAVQLFVECARRVDAGFSLNAEDIPAVVRICQAVAGMPLGIELAAAWVRTISVDDKYLFTIKDDVSNKGESPVTLFPYALISRHGIPPTAGYYVLHEGLIGVLGESGLQEFTYKNIEDKKSISWDITNGWLGITRSGFSDPA